MLIQCCLAIGLTSLGYFPEALFYLGLSLSESFYIPTETLSIGLYVRAILVRNYVEIPASHLYATLDIGIHIPELFAAQLLQVNTYLPSSIRCAV